ncbi:hypothetical protein FPSE_12108 [Fusarium pseudograminearum CS3096]|uniref:NB-ARC domain-containing protein n=1 Tax=Fusarium pseudograminearum (strain CS3096) TaxID=1028729 RepID=K3V3W5_FUSPC|nr:hypothetical protein FPSE_12108 [Fusarium pseudograminearum CS3096]EKJ67737.1 hypothetical protein FPSE_12108 [Fusarium pseudograminearum CS3096]
MLSSLRRVFRSKTAPVRVDKTPISEQPPRLLPRDRTVHLYSGIKVLHSSTDDDVDVVFVHGLKGDCLKTWTGKGSNEPWPKTLLPIELGTARILTYSYDAIVVSKDDVPSLNRISNHASNLVAALASLRQGDNTNERPIVFVCHSLGGLVCQDALVGARQRSEQHIQDIANFTRGVIFLGTPHHGSSLAKMGELVSRSVGLIKDTNSDIVQVLTPDSEVLARINDSFQALVIKRSRNESNTIEITCFYEELPKKGVGLVVPKHSAILPGYISIGIHKNHSDMTKFNTADEPGFVAICGELKRWINQIRRSQGKFRKQNHAAHCLVPYSYNPDFIGRSGTLEVLKSQLGHTGTGTESQAHRRAALHGLGGVGKTQIALAYSRWLQDFSKNTSVFWVHASSAERFSEAYTKIARACKIPGHDDPSFDALSVVKDWLESDESGQWMMVVDNADDMQLFFPQPADSPQSESDEENDSLAEFIPECVHGTVLITTRNMQVGSRLLKGKRPIEVGKMDEYEATQLLRQRVHQGDESLKTLLQLSSRLEFLPLALVQAAAFIQENCISVDEYLELLNGSEDDLIQLLDEEFEAVGRDSDTPRAVAQTWMLSFQKIEKQYPFAAELLSLMSLFDRQAIPIEFLEFYGEGKKRAESNIRMQLIKSLGVLKAFCFIRAEIGGDHNMHRLVQLVTRTWMSRKGKAAGFAKEAVQAVSEFYPYADFEELSTCTAYLAHAYSVLSTQTTESDEDKLLRASLLHRVASFFLFQGRLSEAEKLQREGLLIRKALLGEDHAETLVLTTDLASSLRKQGEWKEAEKLDVFIVETWKRLRGEENHKTLDSMDNLALTYRELGKTEESKKLYTHVFEVRKRVLGPDHIDTIFAMDNVALFEDEDAETMQRRAVEAYVRNYGEEHPDTLLSKSNLAKTVLRQGEVGEAEAIQTKVLEVSKRVFGEEHPVTLTSMCNLGSTWTSMGKMSMDTRHLYPDVDMFGDARKLLQECVLLRTKLLGADHFETLEASQCLKECEEAIEEIDRLDKSAKAVDVNNQVEF